MVEIVKTVAAFANAEGGRIFLGIDDGCAISGIDERLRKWAGKDSTEETCEQYLGALRGRIRDNVVGDPKLCFFQTVVDGHRLAIIEVNASTNEIVSLVQDNYLYIRRGASNAKARPNEWAEIVCKTNREGISE